MSKSKIKKHFLVAVGAPESADFYRAYAKEKAIKVAKKTGGDIYKLEGPLGHVKWHIGALSNYSLLHQTMPQSEGMKKDYACVVAGRYQSHPYDVCALISKARDAEKQVRLGNLSMRTEGRFYDQYGNGFEDHVSLSELRALPREDYRMEPNRHYTVSVEEVTKLNTCLEAVQDVLRDDFEKRGTDELTEAIAARLCDLDVKVLIRVGDEMGVCYGDRAYDEDYDRFEGPPHYGEVYFDVRAAVMTYWDDVKTRETSNSGTQETAAFSVGQRQKANQAVYLEGTFVRQNAEKIKL